MPTGELAGLGSSVTHALSSLVDKSLTRRLKPLTQASLAALGGAIFGILALLVSGKFLDLPDVSVTYLILSIVGGLTSAGIGFTLYLFFLGYVDINKAAPLSSGITAILSVFSGLFILNEDLSALTLIGIAVILIGIYLLSFSQRKDTEVTQAMWLGIKGMFFLIIVTSFWVGGFTIQTIAIEKVDVFTANAARMTVIFIFLGALNAAGVGRFLRLPGGADGQKAVSGPRAPTAGTLGRKTDGPGCWYCGPVDDRQMESLKDELNGVNVVVYDGEVEPSGRGTYLYMESPAGVHVQSMLNGLAAVATATGVGRWPMPRRIELTLSGPSSASGPAARRPVESMARPVGKTYLLTVANGFFSFGLGSLLLLIALDKAGLAVAFALGNTSLLWIALLSPMFLRERLTRKTIFGVAVTVAGVTFVVL